MANGGREREADGWRKGEGWLVARVREKGKNVEKNKIEIEIKTTQ